MEQNKNVRYNVKVHIAFKITEKHFIVYENYFQYLYCRF